MKKFLLHIILFFAIVGVVDVCVGFVGCHLQGHAKGGSTRQFDDLAMKDRHDILIMGSSRAHHHYDTPFLSDTLGLDVYNAGFDGNGIILAYVILEMVLSRYSPQIVIFDVEPFFDIIAYEKDNKNIRYIKNLKPYYREYGIPGIIRDVSQEEWRKVQSGMIRYKTDILALLVDNVIDRGIENRGFLPLEGRMVKEPASQTPKQYQHDPLKLAYIEKFILLCKKHNVQLFFAGTPKYGAKNSNTLQPVKDIAVRHGISFLDYYSNPAIVSKKELFKEQMHLNKDGARFFSSIIAKELYEEIK